MGAQSIRSLHFGKNQFGPRYFQLTVNLVFTVNLLTENVYVTNKLYSWHIKAYVANKILIKHLKRPHKHLNDKKIPCQKKNAKKKKKNLKTQKLNNKKIIRVIKGPKKEP